MTTDTHWLRLRLPGQPLVVLDDDRPPSTLGPVVGVLALQGDVLEHVRMLSLAGARAVAVRHPEQLADLDGVLLPGGESTTIGTMLERFGLLEPLRDRLRGGLPALGTCAGAILMGSEALLSDGTPSEQPLLEVMDTIVRRNAFGRQVASFEGSLDIAGVPAPPMRAAFIRAPWFERLGPDVEALAEVDTPLGAKIVVARQDHLLAAAFHPELTGDPRLHALFVEIIQARQS
ncbi:MAG TPA: pyridoxal 5'-phosphate synthase glutaminase subunit PdxT [Euzebyales bacterium]|nr:pyridoxal 5'-phosphate synthase glutaminase subunit PdxT [Euzebyales bacterium]